MTGAEIIAVTKGAKTGAQAAAALEKAFAEFMEVTGADKPAQEG